MMKSRIAAIVVLFLGCAGTAAAHEAMHEGQKKQLDINGNGTVSQQEYQSFMTSAFNDLDADKSGSLKRAETADVLSASQFSATDENRDGRVSRKEFMTKVMQDFAAADKSGDGHLQ